MWRAPWLTAPGQPEEGLAELVLGGLIEMTNDRERRDLEIDLSQDVDAWLRGDPTRRTFLKHAARLGLLSSAMLAMPDLARAAVQLAQAELADPSTPLGQAQAEAVKASTEGPTDGSAY